MALGNALNARKSFKPPALQITSMMDMFTIIVFFLLFSYSDKPDEFDLGKGLELPTSTVQIDYKNSITLFISETEIRINDKVVGQVENKQVPKLIAGNLESSPLYRELEIVKKELDTEKTDDNPKAKPPHVLVFCDQKIPFKTLNLIIKTAGMAGFSNFQLAVTEAG